MLTFPCQTCIVIPTGTARAERGQERGQGNCQCYGASMTAFIQYYDWIARVGFPGIVSLALYWSWSGRYRWPREVEAVAQQLAEMRADRDWWRDRATALQDRWDEARGIGETVTKAVHKVVGRS